MCTTYRWIYDIFNVFKNCYFVIYQLSMSVYGYMCLYEYIYDAISFAPNLLRVMIRWIPRGVWSKPLLASVVFSRFSLRCWMLDVRWWTVNLKRIWIIVGWYKACITPFLCLERAINGVIFGNSAVSVVRSDGMLGKLLSSESVSICTTEHCVLVWRNRPYHSGSCGR